MKTTTIRTDTRDHAITDLSDARIRGEALPARVDLDGGEESLYPRGEPGGSDWTVESDSGKSYPI